MSYYFLRITSFFLTFYVKTRYLFFKRVLSFARTGIQSAHHFRAPSFDNFIINFVLQKISQSLDEKQKIMSLKG